MCEISVNKFFDEQSIKTIQTKENNFYNDINSLKYYLSCVDIVINYNEIDKICDYSNYNVFTSEDIDELINFVLLLNPRIFLSSGVFILKSNLLSKGKQNQFYSIKDERISQKINNEMIIGDKMVSVLMLKHFKMI